MENTENTLKKSSKNQLMILFLAVMIDLIGFGLVIPILPFWVTNVIGSTEVIFGLLISIYALMQFISAPLWGKLSDRIGRRPVILSGLSLSILGFTALLLAATVAIESLALLFLARIISGIGTAATLPSSQAYISDISTGQERTKGFAMIGAAFGLGFTLGPAFGAIFSAIGEIIVPGLPGYWAAALFAVVLTIINLVAAYKYLPESLTDEVRNEMSKQRKNVVNVSKLDLIKAKGNFLAILALIGIFSLVTLSMSIFESTLLLFGEKRFGLNETFAGVILLFFGLIGIITQVGIVRPATRKFADSYLIIGGLILGAIGFFGFTQVNGFIDMIIYIIPLGLGFFIVLPTTQAFLSKQIASDAQGTVLGLNKASGSLMQIVGPIIGTLSFGISITFPYYIVVGVLVVGLLVAVLLEKILSNTENTGISSKILVKSV
ncbi:MAG: MFS transporter [Candidatus Hodarchaeales archaeon]|jgi:MFS family permease